MKYKSVHIISDNFNLLNRFEKEVLPLVSELNVKFSLSISPHSNKGLFNNLDNKVEVLNLKSNNDLNYLKSKDLIISMHSKQLFPPNLFSTVRCVNVHPGYNPINRGWYPQVFAIINDNLVGVTIHEIDETIDGGKIIFREKVKKLEHDTSLSLYNRIISKEIEMLKKNINVLITGNYKSNKPHYLGNLNLKKDFLKLCEIDLDEKVTFKQAIDKLRSLSHKPYRNAFFYNENKKKIYINIELEEE
jgi:dTDP-4-amino-4,6-dideoxyglucose formyltransferase